MVARRNCGAAVVGPGHVVAASVSGATSSAGAPWTWHCNSAVKRDPLLVWGRVDGPLRPGQSRPGRCWPAVPSMLPPRELGGPPRWAHVGKLLGSRCDFGSWRPAGYVPRHLPETRAQHHWTNARPLSALQTVSARDVSLVAATMPLSAGRWPQWGFAPMPR